MLSHDPAIFKLLIIWGCFMEAVTIAGLAVVVIGGYFSLSDFINEIRLVARLRKSGIKRSAVWGRDIVTPESRVKKMAGMNI
jgi:hypothetical protein